MKRMNLLVVLLMLVLLSACGQTGTPLKDPVNQMPAAEELGIPATAELKYVADGEVKTASSTLYRGEGYSIYIPDEGWRRDAEREGRIPVVGFAGAAGEYPAGGRAQRTASGGICAGQLESVGGAAAEAGGRIRPGRAAAAAAGDLF